MSYFESILIGISIAAIPGPIFFELVRRTLARGFWSGALLSIGEFLGNFSLLLVIFFGLNNFLINKYSKMVLYLMAAGILVWLSYIAFRLKEKDIAKQYDKKVEKSNSIFVGFIIAVTSPIVIALWISLSGSYLSKFTSSILAFFNIFLIAFGFIIFFFTLALIIHFIRKRIPPRYVILLSKLFGIILFFYGLTFLYNFIRLYFF